MNTVTNRANTLVSTQAVFDPYKARADFPILDQEVKGKPLAYLDNAATTQKPRCVIDSINHYYECDNANVHRGVHTLSERATRDYEGAREKIRGFVNASSTKEVVFVRGTTEAINLVAQSYVRPRAKAGDQIIITHMEHHSNIVPWQILRDQVGIELLVAPVNDAGELMLEELIAMLGPRTLMVSMVHVSNALGTINPVVEVIEAAHAQNIPVLLDGAQAAPHLAIDVRALDCDFYALSGHKMYGPTGIGILYGKETLLDDMAPYQGGGDMIKMVTFEKTLYNDLPYKFEAGTPNIADTIGLGIAADYLHAHGLAAVEQHEQQLLEYATQRAREIPGLRLIGTAADKVGVLSFVLDGVHAHDIGTIMATEGVAIRAGHHCTMPLMKRFGVAATARASFGLYNTREDIDTFVRGVEKVQKVFS